MAKRKHEDIAVEYNNESKNKVDKAKKVKKRETTFEDLPYEIVAYILSIAARSDKRVFNLQVRNITYKHCEVYIFPFVCRAWRRIAKNMLWGKDEDVLFGRQVHVHDGGEFKTYTAFETMHYVINLSYFFKLDGVMGEQRREYWEWWESENPDEPKENFDAMRWSQLRVAALLSDSDTIRWIFSRYNNDRVQLDDLVKNYSGKTSLLEFIYETKLDALWAFKFIIDELKYPITKEEAATLFMRYKYEKRLLIVASYFNKKVFALDSVDWVSRFSE